MSLVDTEAIWLALGDFYDLFPQEERVYWSTFWEAYSDIIADLWGYAFQVDRGKSLFSTTPTMERREVLIKITNLVEGVDARFRISSLTQDAGGRWILRGFVPRELRSFKAEDLPDQGVIRIGVDIIPYTQVNSTTVVGGVYNGFVREATFVLDGDPPHDYSDNPELSDDFARQPRSLKFRINQLAGDTIVDAVLIDSTQPIVVNDSGRLVLGTPGINAEIVDYQSVSIVGDRYVFTLVPSWQAPDTGPEELSFAHFIDEPLVVERHDPDRWTQLRTGRSRIVGAGEAIFIIDQEPGPLAAKAELREQYFLQENVDFDISVVVSLDTWDDPIPLTTSKHAYAQLRIGSQSYVVGVLTRRTGGGAIESVATSGTLLSPTETVLGASLTLPYAFEARFKRVGSTLEFQFRPIDDDSFQVLETVSVTGERGRLSLVVEDPDSEAPSSVHFDEVIRRTGGVVGNTRLEEFFSATETFPFLYDIDQNIVDAVEVRDRPRVRTEFLETIEEIDDNNPGTISAIAAEGADFEPNGVPESGLISLQGTAVLYDQLTRDGDTFIFQIRGKLDPDIIPLPAGTVFTASTRQLLQDVDYEFTGTGEMRFKEVPTRDKMWAPVAYVDVRHVQNYYGKLVDLDATISNETYLNRVQGTWFALMSGPSIRNVHSGLQLAMGLPVAKISGTVISIDTESDNLGRITRRFLTILGEEGAFEHDLNPGLFPFIDWTVIVGSSVDQFQPLTNGIEVLDVVSDNEWHLRFPGISDIERFNNFGILVAIESLTADASVEDAVRFALRIKPTYTKMVMRFALTGSGNEDLSDDLDDDVFVAQVPNPFEDMSFDEGDPPANPQQTLRLGEGHKLGQGKKLGPAGFWKPQTLGTYTRQGPFIGDGVISAGSDEFNGVGGFLFVEADLTADGVSIIGSDVFTTSGGYVFTPADVGKTVVVLDSPDPDDNAGFEILSYISPTQVVVDHVFNASAPALDWRLRNPGFQASDVGKNIHIDNATDPADNGDHKIIAVIDANTVQVLHVFNTSETNLDWELRSYLTLGGGYTLGQLSYFKTPVEGSRLPQESVEATQIVTVATTP